MLLDDASSGGAGRALLFRNPVGIVRADTMAQVMPALAEVARAADYGLHAAGYISYTAGHAFEARTSGYQLRQGDTGPLLWFGMFEEMHAIPAVAVPALLPTADPRATGAIEPLVTRAEYDRSIGKVLDYIVAGDIYQANPHPSPLLLPFLGDPLAAYAAIRPRQSAGHGALIRHDGRHILSFSPESFFTLLGRRIVTRPMKGTARRLADPAADAAAIAELAADPKQRAENLMIVDLLRNDISRVAMPGSVKVPALFSVETYPTIHQMISVVEGLVREGLGPDEVIRALFSLRFHHWRAENSRHGYHRGSRAVWTRALHRQHRPHCARRHCTVQSLRSGPFVWKMALAMGSSAWVPVLLLTAGPMPSGRNVWTRRAS